MQGDSPSTPHNQFAIGRLFCLAEQLPFSPNRHPGFSFAKALGFVPEFNFCHSANPAFEVNYTGETYKTDPKNWP
jgi:hypothetical protein